MIVILDRPKFPHNLAAAIRACACFGVDELRWTGQRFTFTDGERLPREERMKGHRHVKVTATGRPFDMLPHNSVPVCIELMPTSAPLTHFVHPEIATYVFGPEDGHVSQVFRRFCHSVIYIPAYHCLNLSAALNVVLAHRMMQRQQLGLEDVGPADEMLREDRGQIAVAGWDGK